MQAKAYKQQRLFICFCFLLIGEDKVNINSQNPIMSVNASMKIFKAQVMLGNLKLLSDRICFQASGLLKGTEVKDTF
ncbi:hypothetical protein [Staphylococcus capitis]